MSEEGATSYGERLLRSPEVARAADAVEAEVRGQLDAALHGPLGAALAAGFGGHSGPSDGAAHDGAAGSADAAAGALLNSEVPRRFVAVGACLSAAYAALAAGDEVRVAGALLSAQRLLFPRDPEGAAAVAQAVATATRHLEISEPAPPHSERTGHVQAEAVQRAVASGVAALDRALHGAFGHVQAAALGTRSWRAATGGLGPGAVAGQTGFGPFLDGLVRWAFLVEAALQGLRADDWSRTGAALVAARQYVSQGR